MLQILSGLPIFLLEHLYINEYSQTQTFAPPGPNADSDTYIVRYAPPVEECTANMKW